MGRKDSQRFSIRKYSFGAASVLLGTTILAMGATGVHADEVSTSAATDTPLSASVLTDTAADPNLYSNGISNCSGTSMNPSLSFFSIPSIRFHDRWMPYSFPKR